MTTTETPTIALLGTGTMGLPIGQNLLEAGLPLRAWNRSADKAEPLAAAGATVTETPGDAVSGADIVITMLFDADSVQEVMQQARGRFAPGTTWIQLSTVGLDGAEQLGRLAAELELAFVDSPVLGTKKPAEDGALVVLASGPDEARATCQPVFDAIGGKTLWLGAAGNGSKLKLVANSWLLAVVEGLAESLHLAARLGLDPSQLLAAVSGGALDAPYVQLKGKAMLDQDWTPAFALSGAAKDAGLIVQAAQQAGADMAVTEIALRHLRQAQQQGHGDKDLSAIFLAERSGSGA
ncbi:MAG TPA: NAD(P)-dependent oxidoreductase [Jatrophihabitans sp.]|nr:NAD(P)-dependent oxidoreductase [Jatrophihabitans sp.]